MRPVISQQPAIGASFAPVVMKGGKRDEWAQWALSVVTTGAGASSRRKVTVSFRPCQSCSQTNVNSLELQTKMLPADDRV